MKIIIDGNIGAGKTEVINELSNLLAIPIFLEPIDKWTTFLDLFYNNKQMAFHLNLEILLSFYEWKNNNFDAIYERCPASSKEIFVKLNYELGYISDIEMDVYNYVYNKISWEPDVYIYIKTSPEICYKRIIERNRIYESNNMTMKYLIDLDNKYNALLNKMNRYYIVDGNQPKSIVLENIINIIQNLFKP